MSYLKPEVVASAVQALFGRAHPYCLVFFCLKAAGAKQGNEVRATSADEPTPELLQLAGQPAGFSDVVAQEWNKLRAGLVTKPGGDRNGYTLYFPLCHKRNIVLRRDNANRNAVWTNLRAPTNLTPNSARFDATQIYEMEGDENSGVSVRLKQNYVEAAYWYYGPDVGVPMVVPIEPLAVWMHRSTNLPGRTTLDDLVKATINTLHLQPEELHFIFSRGLLPFPLGSESFVDSFDLGQYFRALCIDPSPANAPTLQLSNEAAERTHESWNLAVEVLGLRDTQKLAPEDLAKSQIEAGKCNLLFYGPPRTGKSYSALSVAASYLGVSRETVEHDSRFQQVQFHPGWTYGDFIRKVMPVANAGGIAFRRADGKFLTHCERNGDDRSVFLIEEINRANVAAVFGEAFHLIELSKRGQALDLGGGLPDEAPKKLIIPPRLLVLATANNVDRSTFPLDAALLARFSLIDVPADHNLSYTILQTRPGWDAKRAESFILRVISEAEKQAGYAIGHAFFYEMPRPQKVNEWYMTQLRPILRLHLTQYRADVLTGIDGLFSSWNSA